MEDFVPVSERSFLALLTAVASARLSGLAVLRDTAGDRHGVFVELGYVRAVHVAGRFDPLLALLERQGAVDRATRGACLGELLTTEHAARAGVLARERFGVAAAAVRDAVRAQQVARLAALLELSDSQGHDAGFEHCIASAADACVRLPLGSMLRACGRLPAFDISPVHDAAPAKDASARKRLRALARTLHPDRHVGLSAEARRELEGTLAAATAAYHGFTRAAS